MFLNIDLDLYLLNFLSVKEIVKYSILSMSTKNIFMKSKYYKEISICIAKCDTYSKLNICKYGDLTLLKKLYTIP